MPSRVSRKGGQDPGTGPGVAATVRLLHRRRGWAWTAVGSLIGLIACALISARLSPNAAGVSGAVVIVLVALAVTGLVVAVVDTVRLHRRDAAVQANARARASHYPVVAHAYRYPPKHWVSWVFTWLLLACWILLTISFLPSQVNGVSYLAGAGGSALFLPMSHGQECGRGGCTTVTNGVLATNFGAGVDATWPSQVPLGQPFTVREPVWNGWGSVDLVNDNGTAVGSIIAGLIFDLGAVFMAFALVQTVRHWLRHRHQAASSVTA